MKTIKLGLTPASVQVIITALNREYVEEIWHGKSKDRAAAICNALVEITIGVRHE